MKKIKVLQNITSVGVVAVIRADNADDAYAMSVACIEGGLNNIEVTFTTPGAEVAIKRLVEEYGAAP